MERPILYINACVREKSRTRRLAEALLSRLGQPWEELRLGDMTFPAVDEAYLNARERLVAEGAVDDPALDLARRFARAETVVIAVPYWDLSFPAALKQYLELINVVGITFKYSEEGIPVGLCRARRLFYVTTAGGTYVPEDFGFGYVKALAEGFYGIREVRQIRAVGLDIEGADVNGIMKAALNALSDMDLG